MFLFKKVKHILYNLFVVKMLLIINFIPLYENIDSAFIS